MKNSGCKHMQTNLLPGAALRSVLTASGFSSTFEFYKTNASLLSITKKMPSAGNFVKYCTRACHELGAMRTVRKLNLCEQFSRRFTATSRNESFKILGIETSCDDTGVAIVDSERNILGNALNNQMQIHLDNGGILPPIAGYYHRLNMEAVAKQAFDAAGLTMKDIDAVAATVKPGLSLSLEVGMKYGCFLSREWKKPFIPIHHMEAHALTARLIDENVKFPFLALLISGGHCLLALVEKVDSFLLLGRGLDIAPGELYDKIHRRLKLRNMPDLSNFSGGRAVEVMAQRVSNTTEFPLEIPATRAVGCDFSFSGTVTKIYRLIQKEEEKYGTPPDGVVESAPNICYAAQLCVTKHLCRRLERAMIYLDRKGMVPTTNRSVAVSGGVAANRFIADALKQVCDRYEYHLSIPPPKLCNDNGVMIAWNGVERFRENLGVLHWDQLNSVQVSTKSPLGQDIRNSVVDENISHVKYVKLEGLQ